MSAENKNIKEKDELLEEIIESLCKEQNLSNKVKEIIDKLKQIYQGEYRHKYSQITTIILNATKTEEQALMILAQNTRTLKDSIDKKLEGEVGEHIKPQLEKLYDHINLECIRLQYKNINKETIERYENLIKEIDEKYDEKYKKLKDNLNKQQTQYITILGIFASIVLAFVGGLVFSTSVLANIDKASIYRLTFVMAFIALFFGNILYALFSFLSKLNLVKSESETWYKRSIFWLNTIVCVVMFADSIVWWLKS